MKKILIFLFISFVIGLIIKISFNSLEGLIDVATALFEASQPQIQ